MHKYCSFYIPRRDNLIRSDPSNVIELLSSFKSATMPRHLFSPFENKVRIQNPPINLLRKVFSAFHNHPPLKTVEILPIVGQRFKSPIKPVQITVKASSNMLEIIELIQPEFR